LRAELLADKQILEWDLPKSSPAPKTNGTTSDVGQAVRDDLKQLSERRLIGSVDEWTGRFEKGKQCPGEAVAALLIAMAKTFDAEATTLDRALNVLHSKGVLTSQKYWQQHAVADETCASDYTASVIRNFLRVAKP
jgi:hypothetical protein